MGRKKSNTFSMDVAVKASEPLAVRLSKLIDNVGELAEHLQCSPQAINQYRQGTSRPSLEKLVEIAKYYHVSIDYLLGLPWGVSTIDSNLKGAVDFTGLSEGAANALHDRHSDPKKDIFAVTFISQLISAIDFDKVSERLGSIVVISDEFIKKHTGTFEAGFRAEPQFYEGGGVMLSPGDAKDYMIDTICELVDRAARKAVDMTVAFRLAELYREYLENAKKEDKNAVNQEEGD